MSIATLPPPSPTAKQQATIEDLYRVEGKAELINGEVVEIMPGGLLHTQTAGRIFRKLADYVDQTGRGEAYTDGLGYIFPKLAASGRESFCPDASYFTGSLPDNRREFIRGVPEFALEVRGEDDYGPIAEHDLKVKRADYFTAGTKVIWDVDPEAGIVRVYKAASPTTPVEYRAGQLAEAEPAVPGWTLDVEWLFRKAKG